MSWSVSAVGKVPAVRVAIEKQFTDSGPCAEPEETVRQAARSAISTALSAQRDDSAVTVTANGSMNTTYNQDTKTWGPPLNNQLSISVQPMYGFVE